MSSTHATSGGPALRCSHPTAFRRAGFTLKELLVTVVVCGAVLGLLICLVRVANEAARRSQCSNNLKQLVLASHNFHDKFDQLPPARIDPGARGHDGVVSAYNDVNDPAMYAAKPEAGEFGHLGPSWQLLTLPYWYADDLYVHFRVALKGESAVAFQTPEKFVPNQRPKYTWWVDAPDPRDPTRLLRERREGLYDCPSDQPLASLFTGISYPRMAQGGWSRGNYAINAGPCELMVGNGSLPCDGPRWYPSDDGTSEGYGVAGVGAVNGTLSLRTITSQDGLATTIYAAEIRQGRSPEDIRGAWLLGVPGASILANAARPDGTLDRPNDPRDGGDRVLGCTAAQRLAGGASVLAKFGMGCSEDANNTTAGARSAHTAGVNVALCDGAVRLISNRVSPEVWYRLLNRIDGGKITDEDLSP